MFSQIITIIVGRSTNVRLKSNEMKILKIYKIAHTGEIIGTLSSQGRKNLSVSRVVFGKLIARGVVIVDRVEYSDDTDLAVVGRATYNV